MNETAQKFLEPTDGGKASQLMEAALIALYMEITGASETSARSVCMLLYINLDGPRAYQ